MLTQIYDVIWWNLYVWYEQIWHQAKSFGIEFLGVISYNGLQYSKWISYY